MHASPATVISNMMCSWPCGVVYVADDLQASNASLVTLCQASDDPWIIEVLEWCQQVREQTAEAIDAGLELIEMGGPG